MENYGYVRVSSCEQNEARQLIAMHDAGIKDDHIYMDKQSGKDFERDGYKAMVRCLRPGDCLYVKSIDRLGRNYEEIQNEWRRLVKVRKADIIVLDMPLLDTRTAKDLLGTFLSDIVLQVLSFVSENERRLIRERQAEGIRAARLKGKHLGRPRIKLPESFDYYSRLWKRGDVSATEAAIGCGMSVSSFRRYAGPRKAHF